MKNIIGLLLILGVSLTSCWAQNNEEIEMETKQPENDEKLLVGKIKLSQLVDFEEFDFESEFEFSKEEQEQLYYLKKMLVDYDLTIFLGTWCSDSHELIPALYAVFDAMKVNYNQFTWIALDRNKQSPEGIEQQMQVSFVPTIIFIDKKTGKEVGRIVENVQVSLVEDMIQLLSPQSTEDLWLKFIFVILGLLVLLAIILKKIYPL